MARTRKLFTGTFWLDASERIAGSAATAALGLLSVDGLGLLDVSWSAVGSIAGLAAVISLLKSVVAGSVGDPDTAGFTTTTYPR